ncbi:MAG: glycosyltransferase family 2 protein [Candidatus Tectomicrobia bacterium]|nr:glycosyltransferase family 2 protein [Candidatus Tectomicrobia bacterium]
MVSKDRVLALLPAYNEEKKIGQAVSRISREVDSRVVVIDDGSKDQTRQEAEGCGAIVLSHGRRKGVGSAIRTGIEYALKNDYGITVILAGNNKDDPDEIPRLIDPIVTGEYDLVQGSRYLPGGRYGGMPLYRILATKYLHPFLFSCVTGRRITDSANGFRAMRMTLFLDERINLHQDWLDHYELELYLLYKAITLGYRFKEVPVTKIYPPKEIGYTKMQPFIGWWSILKPIILLRLGIKK